MTNLLKKTLLVSAFATTVAFAADAQQQGGTTAPSTATVAVAVAANNAETPATTTTTVAAEQAAATEIKFATVKATSPYDAVMRKFITEAHSIAGMRVEDVTAKEKYTKADGVTEVKASLTIQGAAVVKAAYTELAAMRKEVERLLADLAKAADKKHTDADLVAAQAAARQEGIDSVPTDPDRKFTQQDLDDAVAAAKAQADAEAATGI